MKNMPGKKSAVSLAVGSAFVAALGAAPIASAEESPFVAQSLSKGFMVADMHGHGGYGKSGEGRCGLTMADTDKDGRVSGEEHAKHCQLMFDRLDTNQDGFIDKAEAEKMRKMHSERRGSKSDQSGYGSSDGDKGYGKSGEGRCGLAMADTDKDGKVSAEEHFRHCQVMFDKADTNKDGFIDKAEAEKMRKMHGERRGYSDEGIRQLPHMKPMGQ